MSKRWTPEEIEIVKKEGAKQQDVRTVVWKLEDAGHKRSVLGVRAKLKQLFPTEYDIDTAKYRLRHPLQELLKKLDWSTQRAVGVRVGNDFELQTYGEYGPYREEKCPHCGIKIKRGELVFAFYKYRYSQAWQCGRYHDHCLEPAVKAAPKRRGFCWLTGQNGQVRYMKLLKGAHRFSANEDAILRLAKEYRACKNAQERHLCRHSIRQSMVKPTLKYVFDQAVNVLIKPLVVTGLRVFFEEDQAVMYFQGSHTDRVTLLYDDTSDRWREQIGLALFDHMIARVATQIDNVEQISVFGKYEYANKEKLIKWNGKIDEAFIKTEEGSIQLNAHEIELLKCKELAALGLTAFGKRWERMMPIVETIYSFRFNERHVLREFSPEPIGESIPYVYNARQTA